MAAMDKSAYRVAAARSRMQALETLGNSAAQRTCAMLLAHLRTVFGGELVRVVLAGYMPMRSEISPLMAMNAHPGPVCVPVVSALHCPLEFHGWTPETSMICGRFGADIPANSDLLVPQVLIVPLLAFDARGFRLGYGGGFYDRTLAQLRATRDVMAIGLAYSAQEVPEVPIEPTDEKLDLIVTERAVHAFTV